MILDNNGNIYLEDDDIIELMLSNRYVKILPSNKDKYKQFETECKKYGIDIEFKAVESIDQTQWNMPDEYEHLNIRQYIIDQNNLTQEQIKRVDLELSEFENRNLFDLLRFLIYMVSVLRSNNIIYGVGRGSSVSSYVLYLIGVHRIDSFKYNLDIKEFLK